MLELLIGPIYKLLDKVVPDLDERAKMANEIATMASKQAAENATAQLKVNEREAQHRTVFVAGWRPFIGWTCGLALFNNYLVVPYAIAYGLTVPFIDMGTMTTILLGMLGLGGLRTYEKLNGVTK